MATTFISAHPAVDPDDGSVPSGGSSLPDELLRPVIAGAYARGTADAYEALGLAALFLDREGRVLFATSAAKPMLGDDVEIHAGHLLARARSDNQALAEFAAAALRDASRRPSRVLPVSRLAFRALPVGGAVQGGDQLLHAVVLVERAASTPVDRKIDVDAMSASR